MVAKKSAVFNYVLSLFNNLSSELIPSFSFGTHVFYFPQNPVWLRTICVFHRTTNFKIVR